MRLRPQTPVSQKVIGIFPEEEGIRPSLIQPISVVIALLPFIAGALGRPLFF
jgi:hypothetical protein